MASIVDQIPTTTITEGNVKYFELYANMLLTNNNLDKSYQDITPQQANKYIFNFHGLLEELMGTTLTFEEKYYLTRLNGYDSSSDYNGTKLRIILVHSSFGK